MKPKTPLTLTDTKRVVGGFIAQYNTARLYCGIGYIAPCDRLAGRHLDIFAARNKKLEAAREVRKMKQQNHPAQSVTPRAVFPIDTEP